MIEQEFSSVAKTVVEDIGGLSEGDELLLVTDPEKVHIARALSSAARAIDATAVIAVKPRLETHGAELPKSVAEAMLGADLVFDVNTHAITHTDARRRASAQGIPFVILRGITDDIIIEQLDTDYDELNEVTQAVAAVQSAADSAHVTTPHGTDVEMELTGRSGFGFDADISVNGFVAIPAGKSAITPLEGTTEGTIVVDYSFDSIGTLSEPIELTVEGGRVVEVEGGAEADDLQQIIDNHDDNATNIAEAPSLGTNKDVKLCGNQASDKKKRGTVHFAIGDNISLGGEVESDMHLDATLTKPTVRFDGETVVDRGDFKKEKILQLAEEFSD